jgi:hypothetical protein
MKALAVCAFILAAALVSAEPDLTVTREVPVTGDILQYYAAHGIDRTLDSMVLAALRNDLDPYGDGWATVSMVVGPRTYVLSGSGEGTQKSNVTAGVAYPSE